MNWFIHEAAYFLGLAVSTLCCIWIGATVGIFDWNHGNVLKELFCFDSAIADARAFNAGSAV